MTHPLAARGEPLRRVTLFSDAEYYGGAERYLSLLARHLDGGRFRLRAVLAPAPGAQTLADELAATGAEVVRYPRIGFAWPSHLRPLVHFLREHPGDLLHLNLPSSYDAGLSSVAWAARRAGYRAVVATEHLPMIERKYRRYPVKLFFSQWIDAVIAIARANRPLLVRRHGIDPEKVHTVPNGVESPSPLDATSRERWRAGWGTRSGEVVAGMVARLTARKGHAVLFRALAGLPSMRLVLFGEGEELEALRALASELRIEDRVVWAGQREDAAQLMQALDLFVLPSFMETMPLTVLEAMAAALPVVATDIYGVPELVECGNTGLLVRAGDVEGLQRALSQLVEGGEERRRMGQEGRLRYERHFTAREMARRTGEIFSEVCPA